MSSIGRHGPLEALHFDADQLEAFVTMLPWLSTHDAAERCARDWAWTVWLGEALATCARALRLSQPSALLTYGHAA